MTPSLPLRTRLLQQARCGKPNRIRGFSLVEILVAIVVLSFGMLGMVGMQAYSLQSNRDARLQAQAASLARELAELVRSNRVTAVKTGVDNPYLGTFSTPLAMTTPSYCLSSANATAGCATPVAVATAQMTEWLARVDDELPGARIAVCFDASPYDSNGLPQWDCNATGSDETIIIKIGWTRSSTNRSQTGDTALDRATDTGSRPYLVFPVTSGRAT